MMKRRCFRLFAMFIFCIAASCRHSRLPSPPETPSCDTNQFHYKEDIVPIFRNSCYVCHGDSSYAKLDMQDTAALRTYLGYDFRGDGIYGSKFYNCIKWTPLAKSMPPTIKLDTCSIIKIGKWLQAGAGFSD
jgi:hypothetical protein